MAIIKMYDAGGNPGMVDTNSYNPEELVSKYGWSYQPKNAAATVTQTASVTSAHDQRVKEKQNFTGWDNEPTLRHMQEEAWDIYIDTGLWNTTRQLQLNTEAERIRKLLNPMYKGLPGTGPNNKPEADSIILPDNFPTTNAIGGWLRGITGDKVNGAIGLGVTAMVGFFIFSMFRR